MNILCSNISGGEGTRYIGIFCPPYYDFFGREGRWVIRIFNYMINDYIVHIILDF